MIEDSAWRWERALARDHQRFVTERYVTEAKTRCQERGAERGAEGEGGMEEVREVASWHFRRRSDSPIIPALFVERSLARNLR